MFPFWQNPSLTGRSEQFELRFALAFRQNRVIPPPFGLRFANVELTVSQEIFPGTIDCISIKVQSSSKFPLEIQVAPDAGDIAAEVCAGPKACGKTVGEAPGKRHSSRSRITCVHILVKAK